MASVPPLEAGSSRVMITSGMMNRGDPSGTALASVRQVGPVYFDGKYVGDIAQNEFFVIDVKPGTYNVSCSPIEPVRNLIEPKPVSFEAGETKNLVCDMASARGELSGKYESRSYVEQRAIDLQQGAVVGYKKLP